MYRTRPITLDSLIIEAAVAFEERMLKIMEADLRENHDEILAAMIAAHEKEATDDKG